MKLFELCQGMEIPEGHENIEIEGVRTDSRKVQKGDLFICIKGLHADGHLYISDAVQKGAAAVVVSEDVGDVGVPLVKTFDTRHAAALIYHTWYGKPTEKLGNLYASRDL